MTHAEACEVIRSIPDAVASVHVVDRIVEAIRVIAGDDETAHSAEDRLWTAVMFAIATSTNVDTPGALCLAARKTLDIEFSRWCA